jgi:hypothetical protein
MTTPTTSGPTSADAPVTPVTDEQLQQDQQDIADLQAQVIKVISDRQNNEQEAAMTARKAQLDAEKARLRLQLAREEYISKVSNPDNAASTATATMEALVKQEEAQKEVNASVKAAEPAPADPALSNVSTEPPAPSTTPDQSTPPASSTSTTPTGA